MSTVHAEIDAMRKVRVREGKKRMTPLTLVSLRFNSSGELKNAMPCQHCVAELKRTMPTKNYYIAKVIYSDNYGRLITCELDDLAVYVTRKTRRAGR